MTSSSPEKKANKHILYVWQGSFPWEVRVDKILKSLHKAGYQVSLLCRKKIASINEAQVFEIGSSLSAPLPFSPLWTKKIREIIQEQKIDLVIARDILVAPSCLQAAEKKIPVLIDMAEHYPAAMKGWGKYNRHFLSRFAVHQLKIVDHVEKYAVKNSQGIMTVCLEQENRLEKMGALRKNLCSVQNTPPLSFFKSIQSSPPSQAKIFAHHGYLTPERGLEQLVKAFAVIKDKGLDLKLSLYGDGECEKEIKKTAETLKAPVDFFGYYDIKDMPKLISQIDVGIMPYLETEFLNHTIANKLFDYMAFSRPVLVSNTKSLARIISETQAGAIINIHSPEGLAEDIIKFSQREISSLGVAARKAVEEKYNWSQDERVLLEFISRYLA